MSRQLGFLEFPNQNDVHDLKVEKWWLDVPLGLLLRNEQDENDVLS